MFDSRGLASAGCQIALADDPSSFGKGSVPFSSEARLIPSSKARPAPEANTGIVAGSDPSHRPSSNAFGRLSLDRLEAEITELAGHLYAGTARFLLLVGEFDRRGGWAGWGIHSCAHWLSWRCGLSPVAAREHVRVARALRDLPRIADAFSHGRLSYSKVRALTRVASEVTEEVLLEWAEYGTATQIERVVRGVKLAQAATDPVKRYERRSFRSFYDEDGCLVIHARLEPEEGAVVLRALEAAIADLKQEQTGGDTGFGAPLKTETIDDVEKADAGEANDVARGASSAHRPDLPDVPAGTFDGAVSSVPAGTFDGIDPHNLDAAPPHERRRADALCRIAETYLYPPAQGSPAAHLSVSTHPPGTPGLHPPSVHPPGADPLGTYPPSVHPSGKPRAASARAVPPPERALIIVHTDPATLAGDRGERCELEGGPPLSPETVRRLACDAGLLQVVDGPDGIPQSIGRRSRIVPRAMRRVLRARDRGCRFPACTARRVDAHHIRHWAHGGKTSLDNLALLCRHHHRLVHEQGYTLESSSPGELTFRRPDGRVIDARAPHVRRWGEDLIRAHRTRGPDIGPNTCASRWDGRRPDYGIAVEVLLARQAKSEAVS